MKPTNLRLDVPEPCAMKWETMQLVENGNRYCASCQTEVRDFSGMSDEELIAFFSSNKKTCGRFHPSQLGRNLSVAQHKNEGWKKYLFLPMLFFGTTAIAQQEKPPVAQQEAPSSSSSRDASGKEEVLLPDSLIIEGTVRDSITGELIGFATVRITVGEQEVLGSTDTSGYFRVVATGVSIGDQVEITVRVVGYLQVTTTRRIDGHPLVLMVNERMQVFVVGGSVATVSMPAKRHPVRNFFWHLAPWHWF